MSAAAHHDELLLVGLNHTTAPVDLRERLAIPSTKLGEATRLLAAQPGVHEAMILSTCNRVEFLVSREADAAPAVPAFLRQYLPAASATNVESHLYAFRDAEAVRHLFRVASSLDSMVVGEPQILGQVKDSWNVAREVGAVRASLDPLLQRAFSVAKRVRTETQIGATTVSIASVGVDLARKIFGSLRGKTVLLVGAGKMSDLAARHLIQHGATTLLVSNRTEARAERIADSLRTPAITTGVIPFGQLHAEAHRADIVVTSTGAGRIFGVRDAEAVMARRRNRPMFFIDIAVPRDVEPAVNDVDGCFVYDIDDLQQLATENQRSRSREAEAAEQIVSGEVERYQQRLVTLAGTGEAIRALQMGAEALRQAELERTVQRLRAEPFSAAQQAAVDALTRSLTAKLLQAEMLRLRAAADDTPPNTRG